jgi:hypothetical protein
MHAKADLTKGASAQHLTCAVELGRRLGSLIPLDEALPDGGGHFEDLSRPW